MIKFAMINHNWLIFIPSEGNRKLADCVNSKGFKTHHENLQLETHTKSPTRDKQQ